MGWCTAGPSRKRKPSRPSFKRAWRSAAWSCIPPRPRSSTARTESAKGRIRTSRSTSSDTAFDRGWSEFSERATVLRLHTRGQLLGAESHAGDDPGLEHPATNTAVAGRHRPASSIRSFGGGSSTTGGTRPRRCIPCSDTSIRRLLGLGDAEVQALSRRTRSARVIFFRRLARENASLFVHWRLGMTGAFA